MDSTGKPLIGLTCRWDAARKVYDLPAEYAEAVAAAGGLPVQIPLIPEAAAEIAARLDALILTGSASDVDPARYGQQRHQSVTNIAPALDATCFRLLDCAESAGLPVLGICFGLQAINVHRGGTLVQHIPDLARLHEAVLADGVTRPARTVQLTDTPPPQDAGHLADVTRADGGTHLRSARAARADDSAGDADAAPVAVSHENRRGRHAVALTSESSLARWVDSLAQSVNSTHHQSVDQVGKGLRVTARAPDGVIEALEADADADGRFFIAVQWHPERIWRENPLSAQLFAELVRAARRRS